MKQTHNWKIIGFIVSTTLYLFAGEISYAQETNYRTITFGVVLGDPLGVTMKYRTAANTAFDLGFGPDYFGSPRLQIDYVFQFNTFSSDIVKTYMGPGLAVAFAKGIKIFFSREPHHETFSNLEDNKFGFGGRAIFGLNITPKRSPFEVFVEAGPLVGMNHIFDLDLDGAIGLRYNL
jgi:hypothetical protein